MSCWVRVRSTWFVKLMLGFAVTTVSWADDFDLINLELQVERLLIQLNHENVSRRDDAERSLVELGQDVLGLLPDSSESTDDRQRRLVRVRSQIEQQLARQTATPTKVTLDGTFTVEQLLKEFKRQTGNQIELFRDPGFVQQSTIFVDLTNADFWPALDTVLDQAHLSTYIYTGKPQTLGVTPRRNGYVPRPQSVAYAGRFRIQPTEVQSRRDLTSVRPGTGQIRLSVLWEPRTRPILIRQAYRDVVVTADDGNPILPNAAQGGSEVAVQRTVAGADILLPIQLPPRSVQRVASIRGRMYVLMPERVETFRFDDLTQTNVSLRQGGVEVTLDEARNNGLVLEVLMRINLIDEEQTFESHLNWASENQIFLVGPEGQKVETSNVEQYFSSRRTVGFAYLFSGVEDVVGFRLVYHGPASLVNLPINYELLDIPLP